MMRSNTMELHKANITKNKKTVQIKCLLSYFPKQFYCRLQSNLPKMVFWLKKIEVALFLEMKLNRKQKLEILIENDVYVCSTPKRWNIDKKKWKETVSQSIDGVREREREIRDREVHRWKKKVFNHKWWREKKIKKKKQKQKQQMVSLVWKSYEPSSIGCFDIEMFQWESKVRPLQSLSLVFQL